MIRKINLKMLFTAGALILTLASTIQADEPLAVVVSYSCTISDISMSELKRFYLGQTTILPDGDEVLLVAYTPAADSFYKTVLDMTILEVRRHWMKLVFEGEYATPPEEYRHIDELKDIVCKKEGAICFVPLSEVDDCMNILKLDGKKPGDEEYPLK